MRDRNPKDNIYQVGTFITAKENPGLMLVITKYCQRVYYCSSIIDDTRRFAYFENNLMAPLHC